ncbi:hypothetical protein JYU34_003801 [Plutella xylostella]|uniref:Odorant receptor n=2 Tax=Plutella xylostella TaxID=51655 RepID=A0ABQ7R0Y4_PLUXY|nr:hypothetical protein JYU34_003801 [Plutella xylostella]
MFVQFGIGAASNCVTLAALLLPLPTYEQIFIVFYGSVMAIEIFMPGYLGSQLRHESEQVIRAVYQSDWIDRSETFKRTLKLLVERAQKPVIMTAYSIISLSLSTFISIMKTAYSSYTLLRAVHTRNNVD